MVLFRHAKEYSKCKADLRQRFREADKDGSGKISFAELRHSFEVNGCRFSDDEVDEFLAFADADGDGELNLNEFMGLLGLIS
jgi:Ca2+-binding EF-hand superfamily protein